MKHVLVFRLAISASWTFRCEGRFLISFLILTMKIANPTSSVKNLRFYEFLRQVMKVTLADSLKEFLTPDLRSLSIHEAPFYSNCAISPDHLPNKP
jgi:hypothetical protein